MRTKPLDRGHDVRNVRLRKNECFVCGPDNTAGMHLKFTYDKRRKRFICRFRLDDRYTGPPGHCHGGIIAAILDEAMGKVNKLQQVIAMTAQMTVDYVRPIPLNKPLRVESWQVSSRKRKHVNGGEILNQKGEVLARGRALFISIDAQRMFAKFVKQKEVKQN
jgi:uncharacterized protein (TIGR00369 family)